MNKIECADCGELVMSLPAHRIITKRNGKPCPARRKLLSPEILSPIVERAADFILSKSNGEKCLQGFCWWLDEDAFEEDFEGFQYSYETIHSMTQDLLSQIPDYKCGKDNCEWCCKN